MNGRGDTPPHGRSAPRAVRGIGLTRAEATAVTVLLASLLGSALGVAYSKHVSRRLFVELQGLQRVHDQLSEDWGRLLLEQSTWGTHGRVESEARERLGMVLPSPDAVVMVRP